VGSGREARVGEGRTHDANEDVAEEEGTDPDPADKVEDSKDGCRAFFEEILHVIVPVQQSTQRDGDGQSKKHNDNAMLWSEPSAGVKGI